MAFDGITTYHISRELKTLLQNGRIRKIYQPENDEIRLVVNKDKNNYNLLISANANNPRIYLTQKNKENPGTPPTFCMVLRKYLTNGIIYDILQHESDRVIMMDIVCKNEFGDMIIRRLVVELMGRNSNIILLHDDPENADQKRITDALKKVGSSSNRYRQILPGYTYIFPPESDRLNFLDLTRETFVQLLSENKDIPFTRLFVQKFLGVSPVMVREITYRAGIEAERRFSELNTKQLGYLWESVSEILQEIEDRPDPAIYAFNRELIDFASLSLRYLNDAKKLQYPTVSEMLEDYYYRKDKRYRYRVKITNLKHQITTLYKKSAKKLQNLLSDYQKSLKDESAKLYGDLITANIWQLKMGMESADLPDYNDPEYKTVTVPLKVNATPAQNAQHYYKKYNKAKRAQIQLQTQIEITEEQTYYLDSLLNALEQCTELDELTEIRHEFDQSEFGKKKAKLKTKQQAFTSKPLHYRSSEGFDIYVGKNNYQNDYVTTRLGTPEDCWLHVKDIPGSHVLIVADGKFITEQTVLEGGMLAAWHSKAKNSENVPVDYVEHRYVKKPNKAKPGMVVFTNQNTMYITPKKEKILALEQITDEDQ